MSAGSREVRIPLDEAPAEGSMALVDVGGHRVGLFRLAGAFHALADRCPHRGAPLCAGLIGTPLEVEGDEVVLGPERSVVRCPWHKWEFDIATGRCLVDPRLRVRRYGVRVEDGAVLVTLDRERQ